MSDRPNALASTEQFEFDALAAAANYRAALLREFRPFLGSLVVEAGAGIGQISRELAQLDGVREVIGVEPEPKFCSVFRKTNPGLKLVEGTMQSLPASIQPTSIVCVNVLEHIREDVSELERFRAVLAAQQGYLCLFVPARPEIYAPIDKDFGHFRRYTKPELRNKLKQAGFKIQRLNYFNLVGYFAWWLNFKVLGKRHFELNSVRLFDRWIFPPTIALEQRFLRPPFGQSLLAVAQA